MRIIYKILWAIWKILKKKNLLNIKNNEELRFKTRLAVTSFFSFLYNIFPSSRLIKTFEICLSDKSINHKFLYDFLQQIVKKNKIKKILEIGIGGHNDTFSGGHSLVALKYFFKNAKIIGLDIINKDFLDSRRIKTLICSQDDITYQRKIGKKHGPFDIVIDDGSHFVHHQKKSFSVFFDHLNPGGIYIIEDVGGSYIKAFGGDPDLNQKNLISFFSKKIHSVNMEYMTKKNKKKLAGYSMIEKIFFMKNSIFIIKKNILEKKFKPESNAYETLSQKNKRLNQTKTSAGYYNKKT